MPDVSTTLNNLAIEVGRFLIEKGGMSNGYDTYAEGPINNHSILEVRVNNSELTLRELRELAANLTQRLRPQLEDEAPYGVYALKKADLGHGCYVTQVTYTLARGVSLRVEPPVPIPIQTIPSIPLPTEEEI